MSMIDPVGGTFEPLVDDQATALNQAQNPMDLNAILAKLNNKAYGGDDAALETLFNYYATQEKEKYWNERNYAREDISAQRLVADLKKAGISPYILSGLSPQAGSATFSSASGSHLTSAQTAKWNQNKADNDRAADFTRAILSFIGTALMALAIFG